MGIYDGEVIKTKKEELGESYLGLKSYFFPVLFPVSVYESTNKW